MPPPPTSALESLMHKVLSKQHSWTHITTHHPQTQTQTQAPNSTSSPSTSSSTSSPPPLLLLSGLPPTRLYISPQDQQDYLKAQIELTQETTASTTTGTTGADLDSEAIVVRKAELEREYTTPRREFVACAWKNGSGSGEGVSMARVGATFDVIRGMWSAGEAVRMVLGIVDSDSTVVFYVVHDGVVKARQN